MPSRDDATLRAILRGHTGPARGLVFADERPLLSAAPNGIRGWAVAARTRVPSTRPPSARYCTRVSVTTAQASVDAPSDPLALLTPTERRWYDVADTLARRWPWASIVWNQLFMVNVVRLLAMRRLQVTGLEHLAAYGPDARLILVANHRSFFDFFVTGAILYTRTQLPRKVFFPVRSKFFYEGLAGGLLNGVMSGFTMFPPIVREGGRHEYNRFAIARCAEALSQPGQWIGMHPEGTRNRNADPYELLPAQPGVGKLALIAPGAVLVPVWVHGLTNSIPTETRRNWLRPAEHPIDLCFGPPIAIEDLREMGPAAAPIIAERCMAAIRDLAAAQRARRGSSVQDAPAPPDPLG